MSFQRIPCCLIVVALTGCATPVTERMKVEDALVALEAKKQREIALQSRFEDEQRLLDVAFPIQIAAAGLCGENVRPTLGLTFANKFSLDEELREAALSLYGIGDALQVTHVAKASPAYRAGFKERDIPIAINDRNVPVGENAITQLGELLKEIAKENQALSIKVIRSGSVQLFPVAPVKTCNFPVLLSPDDVVNAYADGERVLITQGMMRFTKSDTELALVISHELAHNAMEHIKAKKKNYVFGSIFDILAAAYGVDTRGAFGNVGANAYSQDFESEADYVGLYMMALAGGDIENAPYFWRRMAAAHPGNIKKNHAASHPATPERFVALEKTVAEIRNKQSLNLKLEPERKKTETKAAEPNDEQR